ncbi:hypothetical protein GCM10009558_095220 [Virgisporangium aurantiacum]
MPRIRQVRAYVVRGGGADYHDQGAGHWIDDHIATPMARYPQYRGSRQAFGINVLGTLVVQVEADDGTVGFGVTTGGEPSAWIVERHLARFVEGQPVTDIERMWDQMFLASVHYGRKGLVLNAISGVDLALWDLLGRVREEPVYQLLGGAVRGKNAADRLADRWDEFVVPGFGARCVADRPWVTGAETCELALALHANGDPDAAAHLIADMQHLRDDDGSYWTGLVFDEGVRWPVERTTWTAAAVVLAVDAVNGEHVRSTIFSDPQAQRPSQVPYVA